MHLIKTNKKNLVKDATTYFYKHIGPITLKDLNAPNV